MAREHKKMIMKQEEIDRLLSKNQHLEAANSKLRQQLDALRERINNHLEKDRLHEEVRSEIKEFQEETARLKDELGNERCKTKSVVNDIQMRLNELEEQRYKMAEANLKLLEITEIMESQKIALGEANLELLEVTEALQEEKNKTEKLLRNILPSRVAEELKATGKSVPECFENVTVFFSDIIDFTRISSQLPPQTVIEELSDIFTNFDRIFQRNHCERIKTIGDAYMSVCGMPEPDEEHAVNILKAAIEAIDYLRERNLEHPLKWEIRIGVHSGPVVGGIVGIEKYIYDIFGDTINTASRMEKYSKPMSINVSGVTRKLASSHFDFSSRPDTEVKGKGQFKMYFLDSVKKA